MSTSTSRPAVPAARRRLPRWATVLLTLAAIVVLGLLAVAGLFLWAFSGGWDGLRPEAAADDRRVVRARERSAGDLDQATRQASGAVGASREVARVRMDDCEEGQNNWKIQDGYTLRCELVDIVVLDVADASARAAADRASSALAAAGWPVDPDRTTRQPDVGREQREHLRAATDDAPTVRLSLGAGERGTDPFPGYFYTPGVAVSGDLAAVERALGGYPGTRVVLRTSLRYFDDS